jgi:hypothetical protein
MNDFRRCGQVLQWAIIVRNAYADPLNILQVTATFKYRLQWHCIFLFLTFGKEVAKNG